MKGILSLLLALQFCLSTSAQSLDTLKNKPLTWQKVIVPVSLITAGLLSIDEEGFTSRFHILEERQEHFPNFSTHLDNFLQYTPIVLAYGLEIDGVKGKNSTIEKTILLLKSELLMTAIVFPLKEFTNVQRPDSSNYHSFPSGHTAQAFVAATFLHKEYGHKSIWYSIGGYTMASAIGILRVLNNRHWISDVLVGAGIGILSTELVYATHQYKWTNRKMKLAASPTFSKGSYGVYASLTF
jgi:PAP2 superfamily